MYDNDDKNKDSDRNILIVYYLFKKSDTLLSKECHHGYHKKVAHYSRKINDRILQERNAHRAGEYLNYGAGAIHEFRSIEKFLAMPPESFKYLREQFTFFGKYLP